jgi:D-alanyl-lipoteichoic acid acyltransferase DltB (MBOAT superfamily)
MTQQNPLHCHGEGAWVQAGAKFSGTIDVSLGMSRVFGVAIPENFRQLFFSKSPSEFW